jgi:hypothetical protein
MAYNLKPSYASVDELQTRDRAITIMYGRQPDALGGNIVPIKVDAAGNLSVGTGLTLTASDIDLGDFVMKGVTDPLLVGDVHTPGEERIGLIRVGDAAAPNVNLYEVLVRDPRLNFIGTALEVSAGGTGNLYALQTISVVAPTYTTFASTGITAANVRGYNNKSFVAKNTGAVSCQVRAFISMDNGVNYDVPILVASTLAPGASVWVDDGRAFTHLRFEIQRGAGDTTVTLKGFAQ